jgi:hypothetical protein
MSKTTMEINHVFYKNRIITDLEIQTTEIRLQLLSELVAAGSDPVVWKRRFRMLQHLNILHAQLIDKLFNFETDDPKDYLEFGYVRMDLLTVVSRNA